MPSRKTSISVVVITAMVIITTLVIIALGAVSYQHQKSRELKYVGLALALDADQIAPSLELPVWNFDHTETDKVVEGMMLDPILQGIVVKSADNKTLICARERGADGGTREVKGEIPAAGLLVETRNITYNNQTLATVALLGTTKSVDEKMRDHLAWIVYNISWVDSVLILSLYLFLQRWVFNPLKEVEVYAATVSAGKHADPVRAFHGELEGLRSSIGTMVGTLEARYAQLKREIAERARAELELWKSDERYRQIANCVPDLIWTMDLSGRFTYASPAVEHVHGWTVEEFLNLNFRDTTPPSHVPKLEATLAEALANAAKPGYDRSRVNTIETEESRKDGSNFWAEVSAVFLWTDDGRPVGVIGVTRDITARKRAEEELRENEAKLRAMFEASRDAIGASKKGIHIYANPSYLKLFGFANNEEIAGTSIINSFAPSRRQQMMERVQRRSSGEPVPTFYEQHMIKKDGTEFEAEINVSTYTLNGEIYSLAVIRDITERKRAEEELDNHRHRLEDMVKERTAELEQAHAETGAAYQKLRELEKLRDDLVHMVVHDMRSPLAGLVMYLDLLSLEEINAADFQENLSLMRETSRSLSGMVTSLLDVSRMESGQMPLHCENVALGPLANDALKRLGGLVQKCQIAVCTPDSPVLAYCDPVLTQRIFENLLANALKFTPEQGSIQIDLVAEERWARFSIADTGPGIPAKYHAKVFEKFGQVEMKRERRTPASGLGLAFCKLAAEAQGGSIQLSSEPGRGATFLVRLPKHAPDISPGNVA